MKEGLKERFDNFREKAFILLTRAERFLNKTLLIGIVVSLLLWWGFDRIVELLVSENRIKNYIIQKLDEATDKKTEILGNINFQSDPEPMAVINKLVIHNNSALTQENYFEAEIVRIKPRIFSAIFGKPKFDAIYFENVVINIDSTPNADGSGQVYGSLNKIFSGKGQFSDKKIVFTNLKVNMFKKNPLSAEKPIIRKFNFPQLELNPTPEDKTIKYEVKGSINSHKFRETYYFALNIKSGFGRESDYSGKIYSNDSEIKYFGKMDTTDKMTFSGKLEGKLNGFAKKFFYVIGIPEEMLESMKDNDQTRLTGDFSYDGKKLSIDNFASEGSIVSFVINSKTDIAEQNLTSVDVNITKFDYSKMFKSQQEILSSRKARKVEDDFKKRLEDYFLFAVGDDVNFNFTINVPQINFYHDKIGNLFIRATLKNNQFRVDQFKVKLPGQSQLSFVGVAEINKDQKQLKGASRIIFAGKSMDELCLALDPTLLEGQEQRFGPFYIDAKGFLYGQNIHFREIVARINDDKFAGQMLIDYSKQFSSSAAFNFTSLNLDKYIESDKRSDLGIFKDNNPLSAKFDFLRVVDSVFDNLDVSIMADKLTKADYDYRDVLVYAHITPGVTEVKDIYFDSDLLGQVKGTAHIDLTDFQPQIDLDLKMERYDLDLLIYGEMVKQDNIYKFDGKWSNEKVTFERLGTFHGKINLDIKELRFYHFFMKNFVMSARAEEGRLSIDETRAELFGNKIDFKGYLTTEYPSFNLTFSATDLDADLFMADTFHLDQISSTFNTSGVLASFGFSIEQMIQNLKGNFSVATKGFSVQGFDFAAIIKAVSLAKRREYIKVISNELLNKGSTEFGYFMGPFVIDAGRISFKDLNVVGPTVDSGKLSGIIDLPKWQLNIGSIFNLKTDTGGAMTLSAVTSGPINKFETKWDDKGMAEYWENRFYNTGN